MCRATHELEALLRICKACMSSFGWGRGVDVLASLKHIVNDPKTVHLWSEPRIWEMTGAFAAAAFFKISHSKAMGSGAGTLRLSLLQFRRVSRARVFELDGSRA